MTIEVIAEGLDIPEGPLPLSDGSILLVEVCGHRLMRISPDGGKSVVAEIAGGPNSAAIGPDGAVYITNNGGVVIGMDGDRIVSGHRSPDNKGGSIQRVDLDSGAVTTLYTECEGRALRGPNDLVFDRHGGFWFSDTGNSDANSKLWGGVFYAKADGSHIVRARDGLPAPNGIGLSPDGQTLYLADSMTARLLAWNIVEPGKLAEGRPRLVTMRDDGSSFDSLAVEADGRICIGTIGAGGITIVSPEDGRREHVAFPDATITNIAFGGPDMMDAWVTGAGTGRLFKMRWPRPGLRLVHNR